MFSSFHSLADKTNNETLTETIFLGHTKVALLKKAVSGECCCCRSILGAEIIIHAFTHTQLICYRAADLDLSTRYQTNSSGSTINHNDFFGEFAGIT